MDKMILENTMRLLLSIKAAQTPMGPRSNAITDIINGYRELEVFCGTLRKTLTAYRGALLSKDEESVQLKQMYDTAMAEVKKTRKKTV